MTFSEFQSWALAQGQVGRYDNGQFVGQCVSLINQGCYRVYNIPAKSWGDAWQWGQPNNAAVQQYFNIVNSLEVGNVVVYPQNWSGSPEGHIGWVAGNGQILEQNGHVPMKISLSKLEPGYYAILKPKTATAPEGGKVTDKGDIINVSNRLWGPGKLTDADMNKWINKQFKDWYYAADADQRTANHIAEMQGGVQPYTGQTLYIKK